jgi:hypothetical protein
MSEKFLDEEEIEYYFDFIILELDNDILDLLFYSLIYYDEGTIMKFIDKGNLVSKINSIKGPVDFSKNRSIWGFIVNKAGDLDPYSYKKL